MKKTWICNNCGSRMGTKQPDNATWHAGKCSYCSEKSSVTEPRDFGIFDKESQDKAIKYLKSMFDIK